MFASRGATSFTASCPCGSSAAVASSLGTASARAKDKCSSCRLQQLMGESGLSKSQAQRFLTQVHATPEPNSSIVQRSLQVDMQRTMTAGGNESDVGVWRQGLVGCSRKVLAAKISNSNAGSSSSDVESGSSGKKNKSSKVKPSSSTTTSAALQYVPCRSHVFAPSAWTPPNDAGFRFCFRSCISSDRLLPPPAGDLPDAALLPNAMCTPPHPI